MRIESPAYSQDERIPRKFTGEGNNVSPPISWANVPDGTESLALIMDDPDAPGVEPYVHWVLFNIPVDHDSIAEGSRDGGIPGKNSSGVVGYSGPMPPKGPEHHYRLKLFALDEIVPLKQGATKKELIKAMQGHIISQAELVGTYQR